MSFYPIFHPYRLTVAPRPSLDVVPERHHQRDPPRVAVARGRREPRDARGVVAREPRRRTSTRPGFTGHPLTLALPRVRGR